MKKEEKIGEKKKSFLFLAIKICEKNTKKTGFNGGPTCSTPVSSWNTIIKQNPFVNPFSNQLSARKLASVVWEFQHILYPINVNNMYLGVDNRHNYSRDHGNNQRVGRNRGFDQIHQQHHRHPKKLGFDPQRHHFLDHHPASAGSLRRHSLRRHHQSAERNTHAVQPLSPASYGSSLEMAPYNPAAIPDSSIELRRRIGESSYSFKASAELLKVLNRIWSLEEQHASNTTLVKGLKTELHHARARIKQLLRDQRANRHETDQLIKKMSENSLARKSKDHDTIDPAAIQSARNELEDEKKLRKRSESLHRKLAKELFEVKVTLATSVKEFKKEKKSSALLEELCDEFAKGIREFTREVHAAKQKPDEKWTGVSNRESLILQMSESWLDERIQIKDRETRGIITHGQPAVDKLRHEIETFLVARRAVDVKTKGIESSVDSKEARLRRCSLESIPEAVTAPQKSGFSDLHGAEGSIAGPSRYGEQEELVLRERRKGQSPPSEQMFVPRDDPGITKTSEGTSAEINMLKKSDIYDSVKEQRKKAYYDEEGHGSNSKTVDKLMSGLLMSPEYEYKEVASSSPAIKRNTSPIRQWMTSMTSPDPGIPQASSEMLSVKDNTLKAKLQESKSKERRSRSKIMKGPLI
ncbi:hypothetical protein RND81_08G109500 [Saponaria officinalis]|uniref:Uncharacterized protein n=1 Tax=Saponaria officinalis TaxID=3572 RepID=A0AAW1J6C3_SAPOF